MKTADFVRDQSAVNMWLKAASVALQDQGVYVSTWFHESAPGFGVVIVDEGSGEFHLMPDGSVTRHVEQGTTVTLDEHRAPTDFNTFVSLFDDFKSRVLSCAKSGHA
jgi:hypothetical protein